MLFTQDQVSAVLASLGLTQSLYKPTPGLVGSLTSALGNAVIPTDGIVSGLGLPLPAISSLPISGTELEADSSPSTSASQEPSNSVAIANVQSLESSNSSCTVEPYNPSTVIAQTFPPFDQAKANVFRYRQQQSVNLGSWFVHEQWMTPSLFTCAAPPQVAEIDIASGWGSTTAARAVLEQHWDTFINQTDFEYLASIGINTVRLPIGYWSLGPLYCQGTPFEPFADVYTNSWSRVVRAINMAGEAGIGVLVDLHGAPGSQNGQPHSGISDGAVNFFQDPSNIQKTIDVLSFLVQQLATVTNVVGIQLLNEPVDVPSLSDFYTQAITTLRQVSAEALNIPLYIHDAFDLQRFSDFIAARTDFIVEDHHSYFVFTPSDDSELASQHTSDIIGSVANELATAGGKQRGNIIIGEWSCALTPDSLANSSNPLVARQQFCQSQEQVYTNTTAGWSFWSYNKEDCSTDLDWCFKNAVGNTLPNTFFSYRNDSITSSVLLSSLAFTVSDMDLPSITEVLDRAGYQSGSTTETAVATELTTSQAWSDDTNDCQPSDDGECRTADPMSSVSTSLEPSSASTGNSKRSSVLRKHRFTAINARRYLLTHSISSTRKRDVTTPVSPLTSTERAITKGYSDGFLTAKIFAQYGFSKLGFTGQYIADNIEALGPSVIEPGQSDYYAEWFGTGLADGEAVISAAVNK